MEPPDYTHAMEPPDYENMQWNPLNVRIFTIMRWNPLNFITPIK